RSSRLLIRLLTPSYPLAISPDQYVVARDLHGKRGDRFDRRHAQGPPRLHVESRTVPRAFDRPVDERPVGQGLPVMRADVLHGVILVPDPEYEHRTIVDHDGLASPGRDLIDRRDFLKIHRLEIRMSKSE